MTQNNQIPPTGFLRVWQILGDKTADPPIPPIIPVCRTTWWLGVRTGKFPTPIKLSPRVTVWRVEDILELVKKEGWKNEKV